MAVPPEVKVKCYPTWQPGKSSQKGKQLSSLDRASHLYKCFDVSWLVPDTSISLQRSNIRNHVLCLGSNTRGLWVFTKG